MGERSVLGGRKRRLILSDSESEDSEAAPGVVRRIRWDEPSRYVLVRRGEGVVEDGGLEEEVRAGFGFGSEKIRVSGGERMEKRCGGSKKDGYLEGERSDLWRNIDLEGASGLRKHEILEEEGSGLKKNNNLEGKISDLKRNGIFEGEGSKLKKNINLEGERSGLKRNNNLKGERSCLKKNSSLEGERGGLKKNFDLAGEKSGLKNFFDLGRQRSGLKKNYGLERERSNGLKRNHIMENNLKRRVILEGDKRSLRKDNVFKEERSDSKRNLNVDGERSRLKGGLVVERERSVLKKNHTVERSNLKRNYATEGGSGSSSERPARKIRKTVDDCINDFDCLSRRDLVFSGDEKVIRVQGRSGVLKFLPGGKQVGNRERIRTSNDASTSGERAVHGNAGHLKGCRSYFEQEKSLAPKKVVIQRKVAKSMGNAEPRIDNAKDMTDVKGRQRSNSTLKTANLVQKNIKSEKPNRTTEKQKLRDQLRDILLNAGWKIEMRPRKNRCYEDAVYVSPQGTGYWSITKAYAVFSEKMKVNDPSTSTDDESMLTPNKNHMNVKSSNSLCSTIPVDALKILKRNVVNKRGGKKCHDIGDDNHGDKFKGKSATKKFAIETNVKSCSSAALDNSGSSSDSEDHPGEAIVKRKGCKLLIRNSNQGLDSDGDEDYVPYFGKRTVLAWLIDSGFVRENGIVKYMSKGQTMPILKGRITRDGIYCNCCYEILPVTEFEIHAGSQLCQPYLNIFVEGSGCTLSQCLEDAWNNQEKPSNFGFASVDVNGDDPDDDTCGICGDGGDLICCDGCPSTFHLSCLDVEVFPLGEWFCSYCSCRFCGLVNSTSGHEISTSELLSCSQCEEKYHHCCTPMEDSLTDSCNSRAPFCGEKCKKLYEELQKLLGRKNKLEDDFSWSLIQRDDSTLASQVQLARRAECNAKLAVALSVMDECFLPTVDQRSDVNLIYNVVYNFGSNFKRLNYSGFYTFILERGDEMIAAASVRIHGTRLAEMPFIGTRDMYRRQGMCRRLLTAIEMALFSLGVEKLVIPAISELRHTWTKVFSFKPLDGSSMKELKSVSLLVFPGTGLLQKSLSRHEVCNAVATEGNEYRLAIKNDFPCHSLGESDCAAEKTSLCHLDTGKDEIKDSTCYSSEVLFDLSDVPHHSGYTSLQSCQPEKTKEMTSPQSDFVHNAPVLESHSFGNASPISEMQLPLESITGSTDEVKFGGTSIGSANASGIQKQPTSSSGGTLKSADSVSPTSHGHTSHYKICA